MSYLLFADDNEDMRRMLRDLFKSSGHEVGLASDGLAALASIREREPDLVILDQSMPGMSGFEVCRSVKANPFTSRIPVLMLTAQAGIDSKVEGFNAGADDYLAKPFDPRELRARVGALLRIVQREGDRNPTSGLPGGHAIEREIERRVLAHEEFAVCYLDFDHFKAFADTFGFAIADRVIRGFGAGVLEAAHAVAGVRGNTFVGHIGGDDFIVVSPLELGEAIAHECQRRFRDVIRSAVGEEAAAAGSFTGVDRDGNVKRFPLACVSAAVMHVRPDSWVNLSHFGMRAADAKRRAKQGGPATIVVEAA